MATGRAAALGLEGADTHQNRQPYVTHREVSGPRRVLGTTVAMTEQSRNPALRSLCVRSASVLGWVPGEIPAWPCLGYPAPPPTHGPGSDPRAWPDHSYPIPATPWGLPPVSHLSAWKVSKMGRWTTATQRCSDGTSHQDPVCQPGYTSGTHLIIHSWFLSPLS